MKNILSYLILLFLVVSCNDKKSKSSTMSNNQVVSNNELLKGWKTYSYNDIIVNIPSDWKLTEIKNALLYASLNKKGNDCYYVVLNYNTSQIKSNDYIKEIFKEVSKKDLKFNYNLKEISFKNTNKCYYLELFVNENNVKYKIYSLVYEVGNQIYDFSYKTLDDKKTNAKNYQTFFTLLFSFEYKYDNIIDAEEFIIDNSKVLKYEDL